MCDCGRLETFQQIAALAPTVSGAATRILLFLASVDEPLFSQRELAIATRLARSSVQCALAELDERNLVRTTLRPGRFHFSLSLVPGPKIGHGNPAGGPEIRPVPGPKIGPDGPKIRHESIVPGPKISHGSDGLDEFSTTCEPPHIGNARVDIDPTGLTENIDRLQNAPKAVDANELAQRLEYANPAKFSPGQIETARNWLHSYRAKYGEIGCPAPDNRIVAQFLTVAPVQHLSKFIENLHLERKPAGDSYAWFVTVAAQRIHAIPPLELKEARSRVRTRRYKPPQQETTAPSLAALQGQIRAMAATKGMR